MLYRIVDVIEEYVLDLSRLPMPDRRARGRQSSLALSAGPDTDLDAAA